MSRTLTTLAAVSATLALATVANAQTYLRAVPWFNPSGLAAAPFSNVLAAQCASSSGGTIVVRPGTIFQSVTLNQPRTYTATTGAATIDGRASATTTLRVGSYNVRLWPGFFAAQTFADQARADLIGPRLQAENCDIIGLQEVWDYRLDSPDASNFIDALRGNYWYYYGDFFGDAGNSNNSGLLTLTRNQPSAFSQSSYTECDGFDCLANKGFIRLSFVKDGFNVTVFNTHTQAGSSSENQTTRQDQLNELAVSVNVWRALNPSHVVFVVGDFNVDGNNVEFINMANAMGGIAATADARTNFPCSPDFSDCTSCGSNTIKQIFGDDTNSTILDHILYVGSADGTVKVVPTFYEVKQYRRTDGGQWCRNTAPTGCGNDLSDHEAVYANFQLRRVTP